MAGRGDQYIEHGGYTWRILDGAAPQGGRTGAPNAGCQCTKTNDDSWNDASSCPSNYLPLPAGWVLAPNDATSRAVVAAHGWSTYALVVADGTCVRSANTDHTPGDSCWSGKLATSSGTYTVTGCVPRKRVLARCG